MVYSASSGIAVVNGANPLSPLVRQGTYAILGIGCMVGAARFRYRRLRVLAPLLMLMALIGLVLVKVPGIGVRVNGAERWIVAGPLTLQPSEFAKLAMVVFCAAVLTARKRPPRSIKELANPVGFAALIVCGLVALEPDLGTTIAIAVMVTGVLIVAGTPFRLLVGTAGIVSAGAALVISQNAYMHARLLAFMHPWQDAGGSGYQNVQALLSLGSGGIWGKGLGQGTVKIGYLPEAAERHDRRRHRRGAGPDRDPRDRARVRRVRRARLPDRDAHEDPFGKFLATGITCLVTGQAVVNLGAVLGFLPADGRPAAADKLGRIQPGRVPDHGRDAALNVADRRAGTRPQGVGRRCHSRPNRKRPAAAARRRVLIAAGGTAGHVVPALAVAAELVG